VGCIFFWGTYFLKICFGLVELVLAGERIDEMSVIEDSGVGCLSGELMKVFLHLLIK